MPRYSTGTLLGVAIAVALLTSGCAAGVVHSGPPSTSSPAPTAVPSAPPTASVAPTPAATPFPSASGAPSGVAPLDTGLHAAQVMGGGTYPGYTVVVPKGWYDERGRFVVKYPVTDQPGSILGLSVWDVGQVYLDPCHWQGGQADPGPSVKALVAALVTQPLRKATKPTDATLAGYRGQYLELSVPEDLKSSTWTDFDACDVEPSNGHHDFRSWIGNGLGHRFLEAPGQVERLWVLDVGGQRLVVDATYSPDTTPADRDELERVVDSLRFASP